MKKIILITGASSGIGREFAMQIDAAFPSIDEIWLIARRIDKLTELSSMMQHVTKTIMMDVTDEAGCDTLEARLEESDARVCMLVNAAGFGLSGDFDEMPAAEQLDMVKTNCEALTRLTHMVLPYMRTNARIIQIASAAAFLPQPGFAIYGATKAYVLSFSRAIARELAPYGIYVTAVCPGPVNTEFYDIACRYSAGSQEAIAKAATAVGICPELKSKFMITPRKCVEEALRGSYLCKSVVVPGIAMKALRGLCKVLPKDLVLDIEELIGR